MSDPFEGLFDSGEVLERVGVNLTTQARRGDLEPVRCRDAEIARVVDILLRQSKNNPALIGKAGVGKTAIVEGLAQRVAAGDVPPALKDVRVVALDHVALLAGTTFRGQYEERIRKLVRELSADPDLILFVDELHNLIGQGTALGAAMDAANMLKPALVRGDIRIIGATTGGEYDKWIRGDPALERRFQPVMVEELDAIQTWEVLVARRPRLERHHAVAITDDALKAAIVLTDRFVPERARPDKAIDVLDEACAHAQATARVSPELDRLIRERRKVDAMIRRGLTHEKPQQEPADDLVAEIFPMLERIGAEIEKMLGGPSDSRTVARQGTETTVRPSDRPTPSLAERRAELDELLRRELEHQGIVVKGQDIARVVGVAAGPERSRAEAGVAADDARRGAGHGPRLQAPSRGAAPQPHAGARLRHPQVRRRPAAGRARRCRGRLPPVRPDSRLPRPAAYDDRSPHRAGRGVLRSRLQRALPAHRHRPQPGAARDLPRAGARAAGSVCQSRLAGRAEAAERPAHRGAVDPRGAGHAGADPGADAGAEAREPPEFLGPARRARQAAGADEGVFERAAVAAREPDLPLPGRCRVRALVRARVSRQTAVRRPDARLHVADPPPRPLRGGG